MINFASGIKALFGRGFSFWDTDMDANLRKISDHLGNIRCAGAPGTAIVGSPILGVAYLEQDGSYTVYDLNASSATVSAVYPARKGLVACEGETIYTNTGTAWLPITDASDAAITAAQTALTAANAAIELIQAISDDGILARSEKPEIVLRVAVINGEKTGIDSQAAALGITTEKNNYDSAVSILNTYLATLTTPTLWNDYSGNTTIARVDFNQKFLDVYNAKQALMNKIAAEAALRADTLYLTGLITTPQIAPNAATEILPAIVAADKTYLQETNSTGLFLFDSMLTHTIPAKTYGYTLLVTAHVSYRCSNPYGNAESLIGLGVNRSVSSGQAGVAQKLKNNSSADFYTVSVSISSEIITGESVNILLTPSIGFSQVTPIPPVYQSSEYIFTNISVIAEIIKR